MLSRTLLPFHLLVVNYYSAELVARLLASLKTTPAQSYRLVVVNNSPADRELPVLLQQLPQSVLLEAGENLGFGRACNLGLQWIWQRDRQARVWAINPDASFFPDSIARARDFCDRYPEFAIVGTQIYLPSGELWFARGTYDARTGNILTRTEPLSEEPEWGNTDWVSGCSTIVNLACFKDCPQFDPVFFLYYEDFDFCRRYAERGYRLAVATQIGVMHQPSSTTDRDPAWKYQHATFSYLLALERYAPPAIAAAYLVRLCLNALWLQLRGRPAGAGKWVGIAQYWRYRRGRGQES